MQIVMFVKTLQYAHHDITLEITPSYSTFSDRVYLVFILVPIRDDYRFNHIARLTMSNAHEKPRHRAIQPILCERRRS